jgi:hypothetical protein
MQSHSQTHELVHYFEVGGFVLQDYKGTDDLVIVNDFRPHPATIGEACEKERDENVALRLESLMFGSPNCQYDSKECDDNQQTLQNWNIENVGVFDIVITINYRKYRESNAEQGPASRPDPMGRYTVRTRKVSKETNQEENEQPEDRPT